MLALRYFILLGIDYWSRGFRAWHSHMNKGLWVSIHNKNKDARVGITGTSKETKAEYHDYEAAHGCPSCFTRHGRSDRLQPRSNIVIAIIAHGGSLSSFGITHRLKKLTSSFSVNMQYLGFVSEDQSYGLQSRSTLIDHIAFL